MRNILDRFRSDEGGQALVELAFVLPLVLLLLFGIIDFGLALNSYNSDTNLANIAAREASVMGASTTAVCDGTQEATLTQYVDCESAQTGGSNALQACVADTAGSSPSGTYKAGDPMEVKVSSTFDWTRVLTGSDGYIHKVVSPSSTITGSATMRVEQVSSNGTNSFLTPTCAA